VIEWRPIPGYSAYDISEYGAVRLSRPWWSWQRRATGSLIKISYYERGEGYLAAVMRADGSGYERAKIHVLVTTTFHGPKPTRKHCACHKDDNRHNNHYSNLYWGTKRQNAIDRSINGRGRVAKLTFEQILWVRELYWVDKWSPREIGDLFEVSAASIRQIIEHRTYIWVRGSYPKWFIDAVSQI
jgi:hypothetical protein